MALLKEYDVSVNKAEQTANTTTVTGTIEDMAGFDELVLQARIGTANAGNYLYVEHGDESDLSDAEDVVGTKRITSNDGEIAALDIVKPIKRYYRPYVVRGASTTVGTLIALKKKTHKLPVDHTVDDQIQGEVHISPISGTI